MTDYFPCAINLSRRGDALEAAIGGDWLLDAKIPVLESVFTKLDEATEIKL
jgi:hypothetical protein